MTIISRTTAYDTAGRRTPRRRILPVLTACSLAAVLSLSGCGSAGVLVSDLKEAALGESTSDAVSTQNILWESIPGSDSADNAVSENSSAGTQASEADDIVTTEEAITDDSAADTSVSAEADAESLWDDIPGEDTWGPFPDGDEISLSYAYQQLDADEQLIYAELRRMIRTREETNLSTMDKDEVKRIYDMVLADHPEIFYVSGYTITSHTRGGALEYLSARANYVYDEAQTAEYERLIGTAVDSILLQAPTDGSDYDKVRFCYEYLIRNTDYDDTAANNQNIISVFLSHASVCNGYAKAFQYLLLEMDVPATVVTGTSASSAHAWDLVRIDGKYYYCDPTWGDASFTGSSDSAGTNFWITYDFLNITTADLLTNHTIDDTIPVPECTATAANYYVQEGLYLESYDHARLHQIANAAYEDGSLVIRFRCANAAVYQEIKSALIDNKEIYNYLYQANSISYTTSDSLYTFAIIIK